MIAAYALVLALAAPYIKSSDELLEFDYSWSREAAAVPALDGRFRRDAMRHKASAIASAKIDRRARLATGGGWNPHSFSRSWETVGQSGRLLSLIELTGVYSGGAHPNSGSRALLWDRRLSRELPLPAVLRPGLSWTGAVRGAFCVLLDRERAENRGETIVRGPWPNNCPPLGELTVAPADKDSDGRFDHLRVIADSYVAGPYAEGSYEFDLPITATMVSRLKAEYLPSFEAHPPLQ
jgi:hypothetical protein